MPEISCWVRIGRSDWRQRAEPGYTWFESHVKDICIAGCEIMVHVQCLGMVVRKIGIKIFLTSNRWDWRKQFIFLWLETPGLKLCWVSYYWNDWIFQWKTQGTNRNCFWLVTYFYESFVLLNWITSYIEQYLLKKNKIVYDESVWCSLIMTHAIAICLGNRIPSH